MMKYSSEFPNKFQDFFTTPNPSEEDEDANISDILEDKLIPRNNRFVDSNNRYEGGNASNRFGKDRLSGYEEKVRSVNTRRSFHRSTRKYHVSTSSDTSASTAGGGGPVYFRVQSPSSRSSESTESSKLSCSSPTSTSSSMTSHPPHPHPQRHRSSSITITRPIPDLHRFLQIEQTNPWGHHKDRSSPDASPSRIERTGSPRGEPPPSPTFGCSRLGSSRSTSPVPIGMTSRGNSRSNLIGSRPTSPAPVRQSSRTSISRSSSPNRGQAGQQVSAGRVSSRSGSPTRQFRSVSPPSHQSPVQGGKKKVGGSSPRRTGSKRERKSVAGGGGVRNRTASMPVAPRIRPMLGKISSKRAGEVNEELSGDIEEGEQIEYYRLRSFSITPHGICSLGDSFRSRRSKSNTSVNSTTSSNSGTIGSGSQISLVEESNITPTYKVGMLGASGVGKTSLITKFSTSEKTCLYDASLDDEFGTRIITVAVDGHEAELHIIDHPAAEMSVENFCQTYHPDVFVIVYSVIERKSFKKAEDMLKTLWDSKYIGEKAVILVANKADLERRRQVTHSDGKKLAYAWGVKFVETSVGLVYKTDELLVGIARQAGLNKKRNKLLQKKQKKMASYLNNIKQFKWFSKVSCENLLVL
uniref:GTP-binding protein REM 1 n=1 Tax=Cacopsylla melanoneura TaxID=428564 RepID=A0A8D9E1S8_9HEMI